MKQNVGSDRKTPKVKVKYEIFLEWKTKPQLWTLLIKFNVAIATFKNLLNMAALEGHLSKTDIEKVNLKYQGGLYQCTLNVPLRNDWSRVTYS